MPWVAFVGYQIRFDGQIRCRKSSIEKEKRKLKEYSSALFKSLDYRRKDSRRMNILSKKSPFSQEVRLHSRFVSMSVGLRELHTADRPHSLCWASGFELITKRGGDAARRQLKDLDRARSAEVRKVRQKLAALKIEGSENGGNGEPPQYYGRPFSYHSMLKPRKDDPGISPTLPPQSKA